MRVIKALVSSVLELCRAAELIRSEGILDPGWCENFHRLQSPKQLAKTGVVADLLPLLLPCCTKPYGKLVFLSSTPLVLRHAFHVNSKLSVFPFSFLIFNKILTDCSKSSCMFLRQRQQLSL
jgi:hypothetical protein